MSKLPTALHRKGNTALDVEFLLTRCRESRAQVFEDKNIVEFLSLTLNSWSLLLTFTQCLGLRDFLDLSTFEILNLPVLVLSLFVVEVEAVMVSYFALVSARSVTASGNITLHSS